MPGTIWLTRAVSAMLATSAVAILFLASANYAGCRADGTGKVECLVISLFVSALEVLAFAFMTVIHLITALFP